MSQRSFFTQLFTITSFFVVLALFSSHLPTIGAYSNVFWMSIVFFFLLSIVMFFLGKKAAVSKNKYAFTNINIGFTGGKLFLSTILLVIYYKIASPEDNFFIVPFFIVYLVYTAFETNFMLKLSRPSNKSKPK